MEKKTIVTLVILAVLALGVGVFSCVSCKGTGTGSITALEEMNELEYSKWKLYIQLGTKIGANRLLEEGIVKEKDLQTASTIIKGILTEPLVAGATSLIMPALEKAGFTNDELTLVLLVAEQELLARGALDWLDPATGILSLSPRTREVLLIVANALVTAPVVTPVEKVEAKALKADFSQPQ